MGSLQLLDTHRPEGFRMQRFAPEPFHHRDTESQSESQIMIRKTSLCPEMPLW